MDEVRRLVADLDPNIREAIKSTEKCLDWKICYRKPLPTWVSPQSHRIVLLGDSCHAHLPTSAQGASQATESAGALAVCLSLVGSEEVKIATRAYEKLRFPRIRVSQRHGEDLRDRWHNALKNVEEDVEIDPEVVKIKVGPDSRRPCGVPPKQLTLYPRTGPCTHSTRNRMQGTGGMKFLRECALSSPRGKSNHSGTRLHCAAAFRSAPAV
jgi:hypothetical protein